MAVNDINRDTQLRTQFLNEGLVNADGRSLKDLDIAYNNADINAVNTFLSDSDISGTTPYENNEDDIKAVLKGSDTEDGIIDIILSSEGFTGDNKIPDELKDLLILEATSFGTANGKPKDVAEIIKNLLQILERYDSEKDKTHGDVAHDDTLSQDTALNRYFSDSNFKATTDRRTFKDVNFIYTTGKGQTTDKSEIEALLTGTFNLTEGTKTVYDPNIHNNAIRASIDKMTDIFTVDPAIKDKLIAEAVSLGDASKGAFTIADLLGNIAKVLERYDNKTDKNFGNIDNDEGFVDSKGVIKDRDLFLKNKLSDRNLKDSSNQAFANSNFVYIKTDKSEIQTLLTGTPYNLPNGTATAFNATAHTKAVNASIDKMTDGFTLDSTTKRELIAEARSLGNPEGGTFTIAELLDNISKVLERYDNNKTDKNFGDIDKNSQVDSNIQTSFSGLKTKEGKTFSTVEYDFAKAADTAIAGVNKNTLSQEYNGFTNKTTLETEIKALFTAAGVTSVPPELLENIILEAKTLGDTTGDKLTIGDMLKNTAKVIERYDDNAKDKNYGDVARNSALIEDDEALKQYFASFSDSKNILFSGTDFVYDITDKTEIENLSTAWSTRTTYNPNTHKDAIYKSIDEMTDEFGAKIDPAIKDRLILEAVSLGDANDGRLTIGDLLTNISKVLERYDNNDDLRDTELQKTFTSNALTNDDDIVFSDTNFVYDATSNGLTPPQSSSKYAYNDPATQATQNTTLKAAIDTMFGEFQLDEATKDQLIAEALSFDPLKSATLSKILENIGQIVERYDNDKAEDTKAAENVGDVSNDSVAQAEIKEALKNVDFTKGTAGNPIDNDEYIGVEEDYNDYAAQHTIILEAIDNMVTEAVTLNPDVKELLIAQAAAMADPTADQTFTVGDLLANIKILLENNDNDTSATKVAFASSINYTTDV